MKALLLDSMTSKVVSVVYSQTEVLAKDIYLVENISFEAFVSNLNDFLRLTNFYKLDNETESMTHLKCAVFISPTMESVRTLAQVSEIDVIVLKMMCFCGG